MRKEFIVVRIDAAPDGSPQVLVALSDPKDVRDRSQTQFGGAMTGSFGSMEDLMKNINKIFASQMMGGFTTTIKLSIKEYEDSGIKVGDKIYLDIIKPEGERVLSNELVLSPDQMDMYEQVVSVLTEAEIGPTDWSSHRNEILSMINKGVPAKEIAETVIRKIKGT